jgi:hypothetical protein
MALLIEEILSLIILYIFYSPANKELKSGSLARRCRRAQRGGMFKGGRP